MLGFKREKVSECVCERERERKGEREREEGREREREKKLCKRERCVLWRSVCV